MPQADMPSHEETVSTFYDVHPYPWRPMYFDSMSEPGFFETLLRQETGRRDLPPIREIWVAGCGTNQALITAMRFPQARVLGTDLAERSLQICAENARGLGITNLRLAQESILDSDRRDAFDLVVCTGVIHHSRQPRECLERLAASLLADGSLELMVYNRFHRREAQAFQAAMQVLAADLAYTDPRRRDLATQLAGADIADTALNRQLRKMASYPAEAWADQWLNPYESDFTVDSLWSLADGGGLCIEAPKVTAFDRAEDRFSWALELPEGELRERYLALDDRARWQLVNLLRAEESPMLWFYLRRSDGTQVRVTDAERNAWFLESSPVRPTAQRHRFMIRPDGQYVRSQRSSQVAAPPSRSELRSVWAAADGRMTGAELLRAAGIEEVFNSVTRCRVMLTTAEFPHLVLG